jgi:hypothetical protein
MAATEKQAPKDQTGWLIERHVNSALLYWCGRSPTDFRPDPQDAIRFARETDASTVLAWICEGNGRVAEHIWMCEGV